MMVRTALFLLCFAGPAVAASPIAEIICAPTDEMRARLTGEFGEVRRGTGFRNPNEIMELWSGDRSGDWTLVMTYASGRSCIVAMGEHWDPASPIARAN